MENQFKMCSPSSFSNLIFKELKKVFGTGQSVRVKNIFQFPEGEVWLDTLLKPLKNKKGEIYAVLGISRDISEDKLEEIGD